MIKINPKLIQLNDVYSSNEVKTNKVWVDGKPIYRKVITDTIVNDSGTFMSKGHGASNIDSKVDISAFYTFSGNIYKVPNDAITETGFTDTTVQCANTNSYLINSTITYIIEYTKTTD